MAKQEKYDYVLWDWNGTLFNDVDASINSINISLKQYNLPLMTRKRYFDLFCFPVEKYYKKLGFDFSKASYDELAEDFIANYLIESKERAFLQQGAKEMLQYIDNLGIKQSILSASEKQILIERVKFYGIEMFFEEILALDNIFAESKLELGMEWIKTKNNNQRIVLIGDSPHDYEVATKMGIDCILFSGGHSTKQELLSKNVIVIDHLHQLKEYVYEEETNLENKKCGCC